MANAGRAADYAHNEQRLSEHVAATGIELVEGTGPARFLDPHTVAVGDGRRWQADRIILAVGGHPGRLPIPGAELALTYTDMRALTALPGRVAVIGGADTGCQLASILADFGCQTLLLEYAPRLIPRADQDTSAALDAAFTRRGIEVVTGASAERLVRVDGGVEVHYQQADGSARRLVDAVFFAVGWPANLEGLALATAGVAAERGHIPVNDWLQTNVAHIFAVGDVNGRSMLVPSARHEGRLAAENAVLGTRRRVAHEIVPTGSFTDPEYASVGLTEAQARERYDCAVAVVRYDYLLRAVIDGHAEGFCKLIVERRQRYLLGAHVLGRVLGRGHPGRRRRYGRQPARGAARRAPAGLPDFHRGLGHGRPATGPRSGSGPHAPLTQRPRPRQNQAGLDAETGLLGARLLGCARSRRACGRWTPPATSRCAAIGVRPIDSLPVDGPPSSAHSGRNRGGRTIWAGPAGRARIRAPSQKTNLRLRRHVYLAKRHRVCQVFRQSPGQR